MEITEEFKAQFKKAQDEAVAAVTELRTLSETNKDELAEYKGKVEKLEGVIGKFEDVNTKLVSMNAANEKNEADFKSKIEEMEKKLYRMPTTGTVAEAKNAPEFKAFDKVMRHGINGEVKFEDGEFKYLRTDSDAAGGYLVPDAQISELDKDIIEISPIRSFARIKKTTNRTYPLAIRTTNLSSNMTGEGESSVDSQAVYRVVDVPVKKITAETAISIEELQDAAFSMEMLMKDDINEEFARKEGNQFVLGAGAGNDMTGFMVDSQISSINSGIADDIEWNNFIDLTDIKEGYKLTYGMKRSTAIRAQKLKNGVGDYLWQPSVEAGKPATINGIPYFIAQDMAAIGAGNSPVICGDFSRGFTIVDRVGMAVVRDELTLASQGLVRLIAHKRVGSKVTKGEAFLKLTCST